MSGTPPRKAVAAAPHDDLALASCLWHETAVQGGLKVAFFVGYAFPHVDERRMRRFQDPWNVVKDVD